MTWTAGGVLGGAWILGVAAAMVLASGRALVGVVALALVAPALALAAVLRPALVPLAAVAALAGIARAELEQPDPGLVARAAALAGQSAVVTGRVVEDPRPQAGGFDVVVRPDAILGAAGEPLAAAGNVLVRVRGPGLPDLGDVVSAGGRLAIPQQLPGFDRRAYLAASDGAYLEVRTSQLQVVSGPSDPGAGVAALPGQIRRAYQAGVASVLPEPHASVLVGVVLGVRSQVPASLRQALIATGLVHLLVLSGLKVAVFSRLLAGALRPVAGRASLVPVLALVALYAMAGGSTAAAVRAAAMGGLGALGAHLGRPAHVWTSLAVVGAAMLAWRPSLVWDVGFQLSFIGTAAIVLGAAPIERRLGLLPRWFREPFAVTLAAQAGTVPLMATNFHLISPVAPLANALVLPLLPAMVVGGLLVPGLAVLPDALHVLALPLAGLLAYLEQVAYLLARLPAASIPAPDLSGLPGIAYYVALAGSVLAFRSAGGRRLLALGLAVGVPLAVAGAELVASAQAPAAAVVLSVGDGDAVLLTGPAGHVLIDGGAAPGRLAAALGARLPPWVRELDGVVITSAGRGQTGGLSGLSLPARTLVIPDGPFPGSAWRTAALPSLTRGAAVLRLRAGQRLALAGFDLEALAPADAGPDADPASIGLALRVRGPAGGTFCELAELDPQAQLAAVAGLPGTCDALLLPQGGRSGPDDQVLAATGRPRLIASTGGGRLDRKYSGGLVERTDQEGDVVLPL